MERYNDIRGIRLTPLISPQSVLSPAHPPHTKKTLPSHTRWCKMILWIYFTLGNIFGFRAESRSEGARDPLLFSPGAHALTPDQQDGVWGGTAAVAEELVFSNSMPTSWKNGALPRMSSRKKLRTTLALSLKSLWTQKRARRDGRARQTDAGNCGVAFCCIYNFVLQQL